MITTKKGNRKMILYILLAVSIVLVLIGFIVYVINLNTLTIKVGILMLFSGLFGIIAYLVLTW